MTTSSAARATATADATTQDGFAADWQRWHEGHEARRADGHGFLAITGLYWLDKTPTEVPGIPGRWSTGENGPVVDLAEGESLRRVGLDEADGDDAEDLTGTVALGVIPERGGVTLHAGDVAIEVARRGGNDIVRPRDPAHATRVEYRGTPTFAPDPRWAVTGTYRAFASPRPTTVGAVVEGLEHVYDAPGEVVFDVDGGQHTLTVFDGHEPGSLFALFTDATSGVTTYAANRSLAIAAPDADGAVVLDFNRATNLPCAYTTFATCPLPPAENRLPVAVEAGEKKP
ncbi:DUF1684 domain-containing protein [Tersicoccus sp. Bi-70]|uniref:DUF1684 domain-containing protein n=1 Tax=Tersicoccus sp. Bi-70 TaxID=1897634 RepID=UPI000975F10C|nr:DUF1684 domain-containing protein [Tersicoccus sp. Bi-70]OMH36932.1 hypothetical protein BGP79_14505 [Tersicoccus sp. Bi-70]